MIHALGSALMHIPTAMFQWGCAIFALCCMFIIGRAKPRKMRFAQRKAPIDLYGKYDYFSREDD